LKLIFPHFQVHGLLLEKEELISFGRDAMHRESVRTLHTAGGNIEIRRDLDSFGRISTQEVPSVPGTGRVYRYDALGQLSSVFSSESAEGNARRTQYAYDSIGRLIAAQTELITGQNSLGGAENMRAELDSRYHYLFDPAGNRIQTKVDRLAQSERGHFTRDDERLSWEGRARANFASDDFNLLQSEAEVSKSKVNDFISWKDNRVSVHSINNASTLYRYDAFGNRTESKHPNGTTTMFKYDLLHRLIEVRSKTGITAYRYDPMGRRMVKTSYPESGNSRGESTYFGWDSDHLVHTETSSFVTLTVYEPNSYIPLLSVSKKKGGADILESVLGLDKANGSGHAGISYEQKKLIYSTLNSVLADPQLAAKSLKKTLGTNDVLSKAFSASGDEEGVRESGEELSKLILLHQETKKNEPINVYHYYCDHLGTPVALVAGRGEFAGCVVWSADYDPWGNVVRENNPHCLDQPIRFQGQQYDVESDLHYNRYRYYDPLLGVFLTQDPIGIEGGTNLTQFVYGNPLNTIDPLGLDPPGARAPGGSIGLGIEANNPGAYKGGTHFVLDDPGHTYAYVKDDSGKTMCVYSVGPVNPIGASNAKTFKKSGVPGRTDYPIAESSRTWEWSLDKKKYEECKKLCEDSKAKKTTYSPASQCTSEAIKLAKACGAPVPDGVGPVTAKVGPFSDGGNYPNPYKLNEQLSGISSPKPVTVAPGTYKP
jgi:RHS repeat-associated protein